jgi:TRAP-type C4-dicarboxylate transport system permease small subunit
MNRVSGLLMNASRRCDRVVEIVLAAGGMAMAAVVTAQVVRRYVFNDSLFWSGELARYILVWITFLGASTAYRRGAHPGIDVLTGRLPRPHRRLAAIFSHLVAMVFSGAMIVYGIRFAWFVRMQISPALALPKWVVFAAVPAGGVLLLLHAAAGAATVLGEGRHER